MVFVILVFSHLYLATLMYILHSQFLGETERGLLQKHQTTIYLNFAHTSISGQKKVLQIGVKESSAILSKLSLKSHSGKYKILVLWLPEKLSSAAANKLLKTIEEPNEKTVLLLITHDLSGVLPTIISRCLVFSIPPLGGKQVERW